MYVLKAQNYMTYDATIEVKYIVLDLKTALGPGKDYGLITQMKCELYEFVEIFYPRCFLHGENKI